MPTEDVTGTGTPAPAQEVGFGYVADAGEAGIILFLAIIFVMLWVFFLTLVVFERNNR